MLLLAVRRAVQDARATPTFEEGHIIRLAPCTPLLQKDLRCPFHQCRPGIGNVAIPMHSTLHEHSTGSGPNPPSIFFRHLMRQVGRDSIYFGCNVRIAAAEFPIGTDGEPNVGELRNKAVVQNKDTVLRDDNSCHRHLGVPQSSAGRLHDASTQNGFRREHASAVAQCGGHEPDQSTRLRARQVGSLVQINENRHLENNMLRNLRAFSNEDQTRCLE